MVFIAFLIFFVDLQQFAAWTASTWSTTINLKKIVQILRLRKTIKKSFSSPKSRMHLQANYVRKIIKKIILVFVTIFVYCQMHLFLDFRACYVGSIMVMLYVQQKVNLMPSFLQLHRILQIETSFKTFFFSFCRLWLSVLLFLIL